MRNNFPNGFLVHRYILCQYFKMFPFILLPPSSFEVVYCFICGRRSVVAARYQIVCLVIASFQVFHSISRAARTIHMDTTRIHGTNWF